jgi:hypothetical protein
MKILFFTSTEEDYLSDSLLIGFRRLLGKNCVDYPKKDILYKNCPSESLKRVRGFGFTLYSGLLDDIEIDRFHIRVKIENKYFDYIIFSDIWRQFGYYVQWISHLNERNFDPSRIVFIDGQDTPQVYPYAGLWARNHQLWLVPKVLKRSLYFKRELTSDSRFNWWHRLLPNLLRRNFPVAQNILPISFAFPEEKIITQFPEKKKIFPRHIVDKEICAHFSKSSDSYSFMTEAEYYSDLQSSKFGITTKRSGWDCLRHYEIAANGSVPCFRDLQMKPKNCAPHGLNSTNCIMYRNYEDLMFQISHLDENQYLALQQRAISWVKNNTTIEKAQYVLRCLEGDFDLSELISS